MEGMVVTEMVELDVLTDRVTLAVEGVFREELVGGIY
jgi:hypothetical protein